MLSVKIELRKYKEQRENKGWGCGYVLIPKYHPILIKLELNRDNAYFSLQPKGFDLEISLSNWDKEKEFYKIGFDTAHIHNNNTHDKNFVQSKANELKSIVEAFTQLDAKVLLDKKIEGLKFRTQMYI